VTWADNHISRLLEGETVSFRPQGNSMSPKIESGQLCTVEPVDVHDCHVGDIVLCRVGGAQYLHLVSAKNRREGQVQIRNNSGRVNGWTAQVYGRLVKVEA
jgi:hypothetical protein